VELEEIIRRTNILQTGRKDKLCAVQECMGGKKGKGTRAVLGGEITLEEKEGGHSKTNYRERNEQLKDQL